MAKVSMNDVLRELRRREVRFDTFGDIDFLPEKIYDHLTACQSLLNRFNNSYGKLKDGDPKVKALIAKLGQGLKEAKITTDKIDDLI